MEREWWFQKSSALVWCLAVDLPAWFSPKSSNYEARRDPNMSEECRGTCRWIIYSQLYLLCCWSFFWSVILCWKSSSFHPGLPADEATRPRKGLDSLAICLSDGTDGPPKDELQRNRWICSQPIQPQFSRNSFRWLKMKIKSIQMSISSATRKCEESPHQIKRERIFMGKTLYYHAAQDEESKIGPSFFTPQYGEFYCRGMSNPFEDFHKN